MLLVPDKVCWQSFRYCLAMAANKYNIRVHAAVMMGKHIHLLVTDMDGDLPKFMAWFIRQFARCIQQHRGWQWPVWEPGSYSNQHIVSEEALWDALLYIFCNPIKAGLVASVEEFRRGLITTKRLEAGKLIATKPPVLFTESAPAEVTLKLHAPSMLGFGVRKFARSAAALLPDAVYQARSGIRRVLGWKKVLATNPRSEPKTPRRKGERSPALKAVVGKALQEAITELRAFREAYREAFEAFSQGAYKTLFPHGTYWMVRHCNACVCDS